MSGKMFQNYVYNLHYEDLVNNQAKITEEFSFAR